MCGLGREPTVGDGTQGEPSGPLGDLLNTLRKFRREREQEGPVSANLADPLAPYGGTLLRPTPTATGIGAAPGTERRRLRARTLGIQQLGVPLPGRLQGGLDLPNFD